MPMFIDSTLSIIWSFFFIITTIIFLISMFYFLVSGNWERLIHGFEMSFIFVSFEMLAGFMQLLAALILDHHGAKLKYLLFAPLYMLFFWMINPITIATTFVPALKTILGFGSGTWVSPKRQQFVKDADKTKKN